MQVIARSQETQTSFSLYGPGASDVAISMITAGAYKCLLRDIGYNITSSELANSCPKPSLIAKLEVDLAADVLAKVLHEIKCGGVKEVAIITDHGHRGGQDHFVIVLV